MSLAAVVAWSFAMYGWALVLTRGEGPFGLLTRARRYLKARAGAGEDGRQRETLLSCPMCMGTWLGAVSMVAWYLADRWPAIRPALDVIHGAGAAAGVAWLGVHVAALARRGAEAAEQTAWAARIWGTARKAHDDAHTRARVARAAAIAADDAAPEAGLHVGLWADVKRLEAEARTYHL